MTKQEIGAIRIGPDETAFEIPRGVAGRFVASVKRTASEDDDGLMFRGDGRPPPPAAPRADPRPFAHKGAADVSQAGEGALNRRSVRRAGDSLGSGA